MRQRREGYALPGMSSIGDLVRERLSHAQADGPIQYAKQIEREILTACPEFATSWAVPWLVTLCLEGQLPEPTLAEAIAEYRWQRRRSDAGLMSRPIIHHPSYFAVILRRHLLKHGITWRNKASAARRRA